MKENGRDSLLDILSAEGLLNAGQVKLIQSKEALLRAKLLKAKAQGTRHHSGEPSVVTQIDIIESLKVVSPGTEGKPLTAESIMLTVAKHFNKPFLKIDPLKLDYEVVTQIISKPYATKHQIVPIALSNNTLTLATADPFDREAVDWIQRSTGYKVDIVITTKADIMKIITEFFGFKSAITSADKEIGSKADLANLEQYVNLKSLSDLEATDRVRGMQKHRLSRKNRHLRGYGYDREDPRRSS